MTDMTPNPLPTRAFAAFLFDMDGTILDSIAAAERVWARWAARHGLDVPSFLPTIHGLRGVERIRQLNLPGVDPEAEAAGIIREGLVEAAGIQAVPGAAAFLAALPPARWAVVTSAPRALALRRIEAAGLPLPSLLVAGEDVTIGKPQPECFLFAAQRLGVDIADCVVFEDAPIGIAAADASGASVVVVSATHRHAQALADHHATVHDFTGLAIEPDGDAWRLAVRA